MKPEEKLEAIADILRDPYPGKDDTTFDAPTRSILRLASRGYPMFAIAEHVGQNFNTATSRLRRAMAALGLTKPGLTLNVFERIESILRSK